MDNIDEIAEELEKYFLLHDFKWNFEYGKANPDASDLKTSILRLVELLKAEEGDANLEMGRLFLAKRAGVIDIFVHTGTIGETE